MQPWPSVPNKVKQVIVTLAEGLNQGVEPIDIKDSQNTASLNVDSSLYPTLRVTDGYGLFAQHTGYINRMFKFAGYLYACNGKGVYRFTGVWEAVYEHSDTDNERLWDSGMFFDGSKLYFLDEELQLRQYDGSSLTTISGAPTSSAYLTTHANRFYLANKDDNLLSFSGLRDATDWSSTDKYVGTGKITVETPDGEKPTGLATFANHVILFKRYTMHKLFGEDSTNFNMTQPFGVGCISHRTIVSTRDSLYWLGNDGFYDYMGGAAPTKISDPIKRYISQINPNYAHHCVAGTDGRFIYLSLVLGGDAVLPNITLRYDTENGSWWPMSYVATSYFLDGQTFYIGMANGQIHRMGGDTFNGAQIEWGIETKPFAEDDETVRKSINRLFVIADIEPGSKLSIGYASGTEGNNWIGIYESQNSGGAIRSIRIPVVVQSPETWYRLRIGGTGKVKIHRIIREVSKRNG